MDMDLEKYLAEQSQADEDNKQKLLNAGIADNLSSRQSFGNFYLGNLNAKDTSNTDRVKASLKDPGERQRKAMEYMKQKREARMLRDADDVNSSDAGSYRAQLYALAPTLKGKLEGMSLAQMERTSPILMAKIKGDIDRQNAMIAAGERAREKDADRQLKIDLAEKDAEVKRQAELQKKQTALVEVEDRRRNIEDNLTLLENMIKDKGTYEVLGSHNADLDRRVEAIATDMAKLADPSSVARPAEVEAFKKGLVQSTATGMRNSTALDILKNFRGELGSRVANAYKIRGANDPGEQSARAPRTEMTLQQLAQQEIARRDAAKNTAGR